MNIQDIVNQVYHDDQVAIYEDYGAMLWTGRAAEYRGEVDEQKYRVNYITGLSDAYVGIVVYPVIDEN